MTRFHGKQSANLYGVTFLVVTVVVAGTVGGSCVFGTSTSLCALNGLRCNAGQECAPGQPVCVPIGGCGNGVTNPGEVCDDGNIMSGDGCSADCSSNERCGNGQMDNYGADSPIHESCDPGDFGLMSPQDMEQCNSDCTPVVCGDGHLNKAAGEACDEGPGPSAICNSPVSCTVPLCGDHILNMGAGEECDEGGDSPLCNGNRNGVGGAANCHVPECGDGYWNPEFTAVSANAAAEQCDEGGNTMSCNGNDNHDGLANCAMPTCGDGYVNPQFTPPQQRGATGEECDDGDGGAPGNNSNSKPNACREDCRKAFCGDGVKDAGEACDPPGAGCAPDTVCGLSCKCP